VGIIGMLMWLLSLSLPSVFVPREIGLWSAGVLFLTGAFFCVAGVLSFKNADTTVNPMKPEESSSLVTSGIYRFTRNPMYVGFLLFLVSWAVFLSNLYSLALSVIFVLYMNQFQIKPEEKMLNKIFKEEFYEYTKGVRRWL
jgi:protein-S-isoprenylcysteine O-methyltransferase Ste14